MSDVTSELLRRNFPARRPDSGGERAERIHELGLRLLCERAEDALDRLNTIYETAERRRVLVANLINGG